MILALSSPKELIYIADAAVKAKTRERDSRSFYNPVRARFPNRAPYLEPPRSSASQTFGLLNPLPRVNSSPRRSTRRGAMRIGYTLELTSAAVVASTSVTTMARPDVVGGADIARACAVVGARPFTLGEKIGQV